MVREPKDKVYNRLQVLRAERNLTRQDLAGALGISYQELGYVERGDLTPDLELALHLSEFFGVPVNAIFSLQAFEPPSQKEQLA